MKNVILILLIGIFFIVYESILVNAWGGETALQFLRNTIRPGENVWECETKISKKMGSSVKFNLLQQRETRSHIYGLWSVTVLGQPAFRLFTDNGIIESITEHPGLR